MNGEDTDRFPAPTCHVSPRDRPYASWRASGQGRRLAPLPIKQVGQETSIASPHPRPDARGSACAPFNRQDCGIKAKGIPRFRKERQRCSRMAARWQSGSMDPSSASARLRLPRPEASSSSVSPESSTSGERRDARQGEIVLAQQDRIAERDEVLKPQDGSTGGCGPLLPRVRRARFNSRSTASKTGPRLRTRIMMSPGRDRRAVIEMDIARPASRFGHGWRCARRAAWHGSLRADHPARQRDRAAPSGRRARASRVRQDPAGSRRCLVNRADTVLANAASVLRNSENPIDKACDLRGRAEGQVEREILDRAIVCCAEAGFASRKAPGSPLKAEDRLLVIANHEKRRLPGRCPSPEKKSETTARRISHCAPEVSAPHRPADADAGIELEQDKARLQRAKHSSRSLDQIGIIELAAPQLLLDVTLGAALVRVKERLGFLGGLQGRVSRKRAWTRSLSARSSSFRSARLPVAIVLRGSCRSWSGAHQGELRPDPP